MKILIIEDEPKTSAYLKKGLGTHGYVTDSAANGEDGLHFALVNQYDLIILDVMLPGRDGWSVIGELRNSGNTTPTLLLTARDGVQDRIKGLDLGADDYLVKPFSFSELLARMRSILRRGAGAGQQTNILKFTDLEINLLHHSASRAGQKLNLTPQEFRLLAYFLRHAGEAMSRTMIAEQVWDMNFDSDTNVVDVAVRRLRTKVDDPFEKKLIHTMRGVGYVLEVR
jgi:two-component system copper resistance phosphate regulon response regulator CusR